MNVQVHDISEVRKRMEVEVPAEAVDREIGDLVRRWQKQARIPGFRKGHVPAELVRQRFAREIEEEATRRLVAEWYTKAVEEKGLRPLHDPVVEEVTFRRGEPLRFRTLFEVRPPIRLGAYRGIGSVSPAEPLKEEDLEAALDSLRQSAARFVPVEPRPAAAGDFLVVDVSGRPAGPDGEPFSQEGVLIEIGAESNMPEFNEALKGASPGEQKSFPVSYPADFAASHLAGRMVDYTLAVREIKRRELPALDDDFAREIGAEGGLQGLRERLRADLAEARRRKAEREGREAALRKLLESHPFEAPEILVEEQLERRMEEMVAALVRRGVRPEQIDVDWKQWRGRELPAARERVRAMLILDEIARKEGLAATDEELRGRIERDAREMGVSAEALRGRLEREGGGQALRSQLLREKALDILVNEARITP